MPSRAEQTQAQEHDLEVVREANRIRHKQRFLRELGQPSEGGLLGKLKQHTEEGNTLMRDKDFWHLRQMFAESAAESFAAETSQELAAEAKKVWDSASILYEGEWLELLNNNPKDPSEKMKQQAKEWYSDSERFHAAYVGGEIWRHVPSLKKMGFTQDEVTDRVLEWWQYTTVDVSNVSAALTDLIQALEARHHQPSSRRMIETFLWRSTLRSELQQFFTPDRSFLLYRLSEKPIEVIINRGGLHAALATVGFAIREGWAAEADAVDQLTELMSLPSEKLKQILTEPHGKKEEEEREIVLCALQSANLMWIARRPYQSVAEHMAGQSGKKGFGRMELANNKHIMPFDSMAKEIGWDAVLLDRDQIVAGLRLLKEKQHAENAQRSS